MFDVAIKSRLIDQVLKKTHFQPERQKFDTTFFRLKNAWFFYRRKFGIYIAGVSITEAKGYLPPGYRQYKGVVITQNIVVLNNKFRLKRWV